MKNDFTQALNHLIELLKVVPVPPELEGFLNTDEENISPQELLAAVMDLEETGQRVDEASRNMALAELKAFITFEPSPGNAALIALGCGWLVEQGANPEIVIKEVLTCLIDGIEGTASFLAACREKAAEKFTAGRMPSDEIIQHLFGNDIYNTRVEMRLNAQAWGITDFLAVAAISMLNNLSLAKKELAANKSLLAALKLISTPLGAPPLLAEFLESGDLSRQKAIVKLAQEVGKTRQPAAVLILPKSR